LETTTTTKRKRRYYKVGEKVYSKKLKKRGVVTELSVVPEKNIYDAMIHFENDNEYVLHHLWEIDKDIVTMYNNKRKQNAKKILYFAKVNENAIIPSKEDEDGGYDLYACFDEPYRIIQPHTTELIPTGIATAMDLTRVGIVKERGSTGSKTMIVQAGVVDSGYRGEIFVAITNGSNKPITIAKKDIKVNEQGFTGTVYPYEKAIAQLVVPVLANDKVKVVPYSKLEKMKSKRGIGALGSSKK